MTIKKAKMNAPIKPVEVTFHPHQKDLKGIENWLQKEYKTTGTGFHVHRPYLYDVFNKGTLAVIRLEETPIGFMTWTVKQEKTAEIVLAEIHPGQRGKGYGETLFTALAEHLKPKGIVAVSLECSPAESQTFWEKLGFKEFPEERKFVSVNPELYKILVPSLQPSPTTSSEYLELWHLQPHQLKDQPATVKWDLSCQKGTTTLTQPIIYPACSEWQIRWTRSEKVLFDWWLKRFKPEICFGKFMILTEKPGSTS